MEKVYFLRHQAHGVVHKYPFSEPPTDAQKAQVAKEMLQIHGQFHKKLDADGNRQEHWLRVEEPVQVLLPADEIVVPDRSLSVVNAAGTRAAVVSGTGTVTNQTAG